MIDFSIVEIKKNEILLILLVKLPALLNVYVDFKT